MDGGADKIGTRVLQVIFWFGGNFSNGFTPLLFSFYLHVKSTIRYELGY
jgi:hypothetical protein